MGGGGVNRTQEIQTNVSDFLASKHTTPNKSIMQASNSPDKHTSKQVNENIIR